MQRREVEREGTMEDIERREEEGWKEWEHEKYINSSWISSSGIFSSFLRKVFSLSPSLSLSNSILLFLHLSSFPLPHPSLLSLRIFLQSQAQYSCSTSWFPLLLFLLFFLFSLFSFLFFTPSFLQPELVMKEHDCKNRENKHLFIFLSKWKSYNNLSLPLSSSLYLSLSLSLSSEKIRMRTQFVLFKLIVL